MLNHFPDPYPGELLYSTFSRYHLQTTHRTLAQTRMELLDEVSWSDMIFFPSNLEKLVSRIPNNPSYSAKKMIYGHTMFPYYACFLPSFKREILENLMIKKRDSEFKISNNKEWGFKLRYCPLCITSDLEKIGESYWHLCHQIDTVTYCPIHEVELISKCPKCHYTFTPKPYSFEYCNLYCKCGYMLGKDSILLEKNNERNKLIQISKDVYFITNNWSYIMKVIPDDWAILYRRKLQENYNAHFFKEVPWLKLYQDLRINIGEPIYKQYINNEEIKWLERMYWSEIKKYNVNTHLLFVRFLWGSFEQLTNELITNKEAA